MANTVDLLKTESKEIEKQINHLQETKQVLDQTISFFTHRSGFGVHRSAQRGPQAATKKKTSRKTTTKRKSTQAHSTMDMIRGVLENAGEPLSAQDIRTKVKETYGVEPSKSYAQMLYKRARAQDGFFKTGRSYGVIPQKKEVASAA